MPQRSTVWRMELLIHIRHISEFSNISSSRSGGSPGDWGAQKSRALPRW